MLSARPGFGRHPVTPLLMTVGRGERDWSAGPMPCWCWPLIAREGSRGAFGRRHAGGRVGTAGPEVRRICQMRRTLKKTSSTSEVLLGERTLLEAGHALSVGRHTVMPLLMTLRWGEWDWSVGLMPCWCWPPIAREGSRGAFGRRHAGGRVGLLVLRCDASARCVAP